MVSSHLAYAALGFLYLLGVNGIGRFVQGDGSDKARGVLALTVWVVCACYPVGWALGVFCRTLVGPGE